MRHLSEGLNSNWEALNTAKVKVAHLLDEANNIVKMFGSDLGKSKFQEDVNLIASLRDKIESQLAYFKNKIESQSNSDSSEILTDALVQLEKVYLKLRNNPKFLKELQYYNQNYVGRPSLLTFAERLTKSWGGARIWLKREDLNHTGAHKINNNHCRNGCRATWISHCNCWSTL